MKEVFMVKQGPFISDLSLAVIYPVYQQENAVVESLLLNSVKRFYALNIDIIIFDSSNSDKIRNIVYNYIYEGYDNVKYIKDEVLPNDVSVDYQVIAALKSCCALYDYIWICQVGFIINIYGCYEYLLQCLKKKPAYIVIDSKFRCETNEDYTKKYHQPVIFCKEQFLRMTVMGTIIIRGDVIRILFDKFSDTDSKYSLWLCESIFHNIAKDNFVAAFICTDVFWYNYGTAVNEFWGENRESIERWNYYYSVVNKLPRVYDSVKKDLYKVDTHEFHLGRFLSLFKIRIDNGMNLKDIKKYKKCLQKICCGSFWKLYVVAIMPACVAKFLLRHEHNVFIGTLIEFYRLCVQDIDFED